MAETSITNSSDYIAWVQELSERYQKSQIKAAFSVNSEMLAFYWSLGRDIILLHAESTWGSKLYETLSNDLRARIPNAKGFSPRNLLYMKQFYELFSDDEEMLAHQLEAQIRHTPDRQITHQTGAQADIASIREVFSVPWGHIKLLCDKCKDDRAKADFYIHETIQNGWSRAMLLNNMDASLYERQGKAVSNFSLTLPDAQSELAQEVTKDPYQFDFLTIRRDYDEKELKDALVDNIQKFLLELGTGFSFVGREYRLKVGETEQWIDLLFYHYRLRCFVVVEVKVVPFEPGFVGQLGTYVSAVNHLLKNGGDQPTVGLLICKTKDNVLAQYSLESSSQPIGVSEYELADLLPEDFKSTLPSIEEIEEGLK